MPITPQTTFPTRKPQLSTLGSIRHDWNYNQENHFFSWNQPQNMGALIPSAEAHLLTQNTGPWRSRSSVLGKNICKSDSLRRNLNVL